MPLRKKQGELSKKAEDAALRSLLQAETLSGRARLRSCGGPGAGAWLSAIPADAGLSFSDEEFATAARFRLGQHLCLGGQQCGNTYATTGAGHRAGDRCQGTLDAHGLHAVPVLALGEWFDAEEYHQHHLRDEKEYPWANDEDAWANNGWGL